MPCGANGTARTVGPHVRLPRDRAAVTFWMPRCVCAVLSREHSLTSTAQPEPQGFVAGFPSGVTIGEVGAGARDSGARIRDAAVAALAVLQFRFCLSSG